MHKKVVILENYYYNFVMNRIDPRISQAINLIAETLNLPEHQAGAMLFAAFSGHDLSSRFVNDIQHSKHDCQCIGVGNVIFSRDKAS